ncbi:outer membrane protein assembly factor BamB family protein [Paenibacillus azoreducens]|uniref:Pyrrolo-quinoline quinone repeat domain-containing protein n=1 Tax=Paenibacillus azoreducens TaxID=116718 RepID=A0A920CPN2_9BACL|nr:PQQ-binding-like beta-propeller repeat protein [Paenibacillus azoreducens]GIO46495.1 hypothetical protein J34TS1_12600 [Paenibacillus azoreducens]
MNQFKAKNWCALILALLLLSVAIPVSAEEAKLVWTSKIESAESDYWPELYAVPEKETVYVTTTVPAPRAKAKRESYDALKAFDAESGKLKWTYQFQAAKGDSTTSEFPVFAYAPNGTVYALLHYESGEKKLYSINASGKANWIANVPVTGMLNRLDNGTVVVSSDRQMDSKGNCTSKILMYSPAGNLIYTGQVKGEVLYAGQNRVIVNATNPQKHGDYRLQDIEVYDASIKSGNASLKKQYVYRYPKGSGLIAEGNKLFLMQNGTLLLRSGGEKLKNELTALDPTGKLLWKRSIPGGSAVQVAGDYYGVYDDKKLEVYDAANNSAAETVLEGTDLPMYNLQVTRDGKFMISYEEWTYILEPETLKVLYKLPSEIGYILDYAGKGVVFGVEPGKLYKYIVK